MSLIFVYGTLKARRQQFSLHRRPAIPRRSPHPTRGFRLYELGGHPGMIVKA